MADINTYVMDFWYYAGEESTRSNKPTDIVLNFVDCLLDLHPKRPYIIVADSYYSSLSLAEELHKRKLGLLLSCRADKPSFLFTKHLHKGIKKGEVQYASNSHFSAITYYDKAKLNLLTNLFHGHKMIANTSGKKQLATAVYWYRKWLGPLDRMDRQLHLYLPQHRNIKWTQALFRGLLKMCLNNVNVLVKQHHPSANLLETELILIKFLAKDHTLRNDEACPTYIAGWKHWPIRGDKSGDCVQCRAIGKRSHTPYICKTCKIHLHPDCFNSYHVK